MLLSCCVVVLLVCCGVAVLLRCCVAFRVSCFTFHVSRVCLILMFLLKVTVFVNVNVIVNVECEM